MELSKDYFEEHINIIFLYLSITVIGFRFITSLNLFSKKKFNVFEANITKSKEKNNSIHKQPTALIHWNITRHKYIKIYELLVNYLQFVVILSTYNIDKFKDLTKFNNKIKWIILYNVNVVDIEDNNCNYINGFFNAHFIFIIGLFCIIVINLFVNYCIKNLYYLIHKKNFHLFSIYKNSYTIFPYLQIQWIIANLIGLIYNDISIVNSECQIYYMLGIGFFLIIPFLFSLYIIASIHNRILQKEEIIYNKQYSLSNNFNKQKTFIDIFNNGNWIIKDNINYCRSHIPFYIDFYNYKNYYYIGLLSKIFIISIMSGCHINNYKIGLIIINTIFLIDTIITIIIRFYNNIIVNIAYILSNISYCAVIISLLTKNNDNIAMYIIDITIISYILLLIFDIGFSIIYNTIFYIAAK